MQPEYHLFVSAGLASVFYLLTGSIAGSVAAFFGGFFIDLDHFIDFWLYKKKITYTNEFFSNYSKKTGKIYLIFHSVELLWLLYLVQLVTGSAILLGLCAGMAVHLAMDIIGNGVNPLCYFLFYRALHGFRRERMDRTVRHN